jgi:hypothetical protein
VFYKITNKKMTISKKAKQYSNFFKSTDVNGGSIRIILKDDAPQELQDAIKSAHGDKMPNDFIYSTFADLLLKISEYGVDTVDDLQGYAHEIVDGYVDIYTHEQLQWLASDIDNLEYLARAAQDGWSVDDGTWQLLARAQYYAIDEVMQHVINVLDSNK